MKKTTALVLAAGKGTRFGSDKMAVSLGGMRPWNIVASRLRPLVHDLFVIGQDFPGGDTRRKSVKCGLAHVTTERVMIAEGARFLVLASEYEIALRAEGRALAFGSAAINTSVLRFDESYAPIPRSNSIEIHTPQVFETDFLRWLIARHGHLSDGDEWSLAATLNQWSVGLLPGSWRTAMKLTNPSDLEIMEALYNAQSGDRGRRIGHSQGVDRSLIRADISISRADRRIHEQGA